MKPEWAKHYGRFFGALNVNLGCAKNHEPGWQNLDMNPDVSPDVEWDLETGTVPFPDGSVDCFLASHSMEHVRNLFPLMADLHRALRSGGHLIAVVPHGANDTAWDAPAHVQLFTPNTWAYFTEQLYEVPNTAGYGASQGEPVKRWRIVEQTMVPYPEFVDDPELDWKAKHLRNVISEVHTVMRADKGE